MNTVKQHYIFGPDTKLARLMLYQNSYNGSTSMLIPILAQLWQKLKHKPLLKTIPFVCVLPFSPLRVAIVIIMPWHRITLCVLYKNVDYGEIVNEPRNVPWFQGLIIHRHF